MIIISKQKKWAKKNRKKKMKNTGFYFNKGSWYRAGTRQKVSQAQMRKENKDW